MKASKRTKASSTGRTPAASQTPPAARGEPKKLRRSWPVWDRLVARVPFLAERFGPKFSRADVLNARPFRNPLIEWELRKPEGEEDAAGPEVVLHVPRRQDRLGKLLNRFFEGPSHRDVVLDELGTDVWQLCDGEASVEAIIRALAKKHKLERREVELSLTMYLRTLAKRGFIGLHVEPKETG